MEGAAGVEGVVVVERVELAGVVAVVDGVVAVDALGLVGLAS